MTGYDRYASIAEKYSVPIVVTGSEPLDIIQGIHMVVSQLEQGRAAVENQYSRSVRRQGNITALKIMDDVFEIVDREWRGFGMIPSSGLKIRVRYSDYDAETASNIIRSANPDFAPAVIGEISESDSGIVIMKNRPGTTRNIDMLSGEQLPTIR